MFGRNGQEFPDKGAQPLRESAGIPHTSGPTCMKSHTLAANAKIPAIGLGTWKSSPKDVSCAVKEALRIGYRHIDCAPAYGNEHAVGAAIKECTASGAVSREELWITSKLWNNAHLQEHVQPALEKTLADLRLEYLDLYLIHWPIAVSNTVFFPRSAKDYIPIEKAPIIDTWQAMEKCVRKGLVRYIGVCNFHIRRLDALKRDAAILPAVNQVETHPFLQQNAIADYCRKNNILLTAYSPLGSGDRPDFMKKQSEPGLLDHPVIGKIAKKHAARPAQILISWALSRDLLVIPKSTHPERLKHNLDAENVILDSRDMQEISSMDAGYRYVDGSFLESPGSPYTRADIWDE